jgi:hypothetical protein
LFKTFWKDFAPTIDLITQNFGRHKHLLAQPTTLTEFEEIWNIRHKAIKTFEKDSMESELHHRHVVSTWLSAIDCEGPQSRHRETRSICEDAGLWLIEHPRFVAWEKAESFENPLLWLGGIPGAGETPVHFARDNEANKNNARP